MGMTTGKVTKNSQPLTQSVVIEFRKSGTKMGQATTTTSGDYAIYLAAGTYSAAKVTPTPEKACTPSTFPIPTGTKVQNLDYVE